MGPLSTIGRDKTVHLELYGTAISQHLSVTSAISGSALMVGIVLKIRLAETTYELTKINIKRYIKNLHELLFV